MLWDNRFSPFNSDYTWLQYDLSEFQCSSLSVSLWPWSQTLTETSMAISESCTHRGPGLGRPAGNKTDRNRELRSVVALLQYPAKLLREEH